MVMFNDLNKIFDDDIKRSLLHVAITDLVNKADFKGWGDTDNQDMLDAVDRLIDVKNDLSKELNKIINNK